jgi:CheY-like chemotaxis protein
MGGAEFITALKGQIQTAKIPIVVVSGRHNECAKNEQRADLKIYKDIEIEDQLALALEKLLPQAAKGQSSSR